MSLLDQQWCPSSVQVTVLQARGLRIKGKNGTNDAYALMQVGKEKFQTSVVEKSVAPVWKEEAAFELPPPAHGGTERCALRVHVLHRALVGPDKLLGQAVINLLQLSQDKTRNKTEWFKLLDKNGKADKDRGEVLVDIQFMRNNMTASMFDLSAAGKSRSRLGKIKDKVRGKKKESDAASDVAPSFSQVLTDSEEEGHGDGEVAEGKDGKKKKHKMKSLFSPKSNLHKNMSQSMTVLPAKNSSPSGSQSSGLNVESNEGKKKFKFLIHKRSGSSDSKESSGHQKHGAAEQSNLCINGSHVYCEEPQARTARIGSNFSLTSSGHGSMEDVPESSPPSVDSLRAVRQYSPWTEEEEDEVENIKAAERRREEEERIRMEEEEDVRRRKEDERVRRQKEEEELERLAEEKRREEEERRIKDEKVKKEEEERIRREEGERAQEERRRREEDERVRREEERERLEEKRRREEEERKIEEEKVRKEEEERIKRKEEERRRQEEEDRVRREEERERLAEEKRRREEEERKIEEEKVRKEEEERIKTKEEERRRQEERVRREEEHERLAEKKRREEEERKIEEEKVRKEEEDRIKMEEERRRQEEEERVRREEEHERLAEEKRREEEERKIEEDKVRKEEEERIRREEERVVEERRRQEEEEMVRRQEEEEKRRLEEKEWRRREEEERIGMEEQRAQEERRRREEEECKKMAEEKRRLEEEEKKRIEAEEKIRREEEERIREEEERRRDEEREKLAEEKRILEEHERRRIEEEEKRQREEEERIRMEEERMRKEESEEKRRLEEQERRKKEEEERIKKEGEEKARREKEEYERLVEEKRKLEEEERKRIEAEEKIRREEDERIRVEEEERVRRREEEREKLAEEKRVIEEQERRRVEEEEKRQREEEERIRKEEERRREEEERARKEKEEYEEKNRREEHERRKIEEEERVRREEKAEKERKEEEARKEEKEKLTREAEEQKKKENQIKHKAAEKKPKVAAKVSSTNPFDENFSNNPFDEDPDSAVGPNSSTLTNQHRVQSAASSVGSKPVSTEEKDPVNTQREKRLAPQPPGRNQAESQSQREQDGSTHLAQVNKSKDIKSVLPQRSVQMIAPLSRSPTDAKNTQSLTQGSATKENFAKHGKRHAPPTPRSAEESSELKTAPSSGGSEVKHQAPIVYGLNPFEDDEDENAAQDDRTPSCGDTGQRPPVASQAADKDGASQTKIKSSKARAPPLPAKKATTSSSSIDREGDRVTDDTGATPDPRDTEEPEAVSPPVCVQEAPLQNSQHATAQSAGGEAGGKKEGPPVASRRLLPVKPLNTLEQQSVSPVQGEKDYKSTGVLYEVLERTKVTGTQRHAGLKGPYSQLTQEELISLVLKQETQLSERNKKISELEQYIDNLLVRVMEEQPSILMSLNALKKAA